MRAPTAEVSNTPGTRSKALPDIISTKARSQHMTKTVSICLPCLNTRPFLPERFDSILGQTYQDWELIVCDSFSDDGSWEYICERASEDSRVKIWQTPRMGIYAGFNDCIKRAGGEYIYIATSDDTMALNCIEKMVKALELHTECDMAHCPVRALGDDADAFNLGWREESFFSRSSGELCDLPHIRYAPYDGLLHTFGHTVYISVTQLMMRRSLFDTVGLFQGKWGNVADFHWEMKASLCSNVVHVPDTWGGWRIHEGQATSGSGQGTFGWRATMNEMIQDALRFRQDVRCDWFANLISDVRMREHQQFVDFEWRYFRNKTKKGKLRHLAAQALKNPGRTANYFYSRRGKKSSKYGEARSEVERLVRLHYTGEWMRRV